MNPKPATQSENYNRVRDDVRPGTSELVIGLIAKQLDRASEAAGRVEAEGSVVRDMKGSVIPHPAIQVEIGATKLAVDLIKKSK